MDKSDDGSDCNNSSGHSSDGSDCGDHGSPSHSNDESHGSSGVNSGGTTNDSSGSSGGNGSSGSSCSRSSDSGKSSNDSSSSNSEHYSTTVVAKRMKSKFFKVKIFIFSEYFMNVNNYHFFSNKNSLPAKLRVDSNEDKARHDFLVTFLFETYFYSLYP